MFARSQNHTVDRVLVKLKQACCRSYAYSLGSVMYDLSDRLGRQMQAKKGAGLSGSKALTTGAAVKQIPVFVLAVFATYGDVALTAQAIILA